LNSQVTLPSNGYLDTFKVGSNQVIKSYTSNPDIGPKRFENNFFLIFLDTKFLLFKRMLKE